MPKEEHKTFCILCQTPLLFAQLYVHGEMAMWCNNPECPRFGLATFISTPIGKVDKDKLKDELGKNKDKS